MAIAPSQSRDAMRAEDAHQRQFRVLVPALADARHHVAALGLGEDVIPIPNDNRLFRQWTPPLPIPLLHSEWRRGMGRGGTFEGFHRVSLRNGIRHEDR